MLFRPKKFSGATSPRSLFFLVSLTLCCADTPKYPELAEQVIECLSRQREEGKYCISFVMSNGKSFAELSEVVFQCVGSKEPDWWSEMHCCDNFNTSHEEHCSQSRNLWSFRITIMFTIISFTGIAVSRLLLRLIPSLITCLQAWGQNYRIQQLFFNPKPFGYKPNPIPREKSPKFLCQIVKKSPSL